MRQITSVALALLALANSPEVDARKNLVSATEERLRGRTNDPKVGTATCEDRCVFGNDTEDKVFWCFVFEEPLVTFGWEYEQDANTSTESTPNKHLRWDLIYYLENQISIQSIMDVYRLIYWEYIAEIPRVDMKIDIGMIINEYAQYCPHVAWNRSAVGVQGTYRFEFMNCQKAFLKSPWDFQNVWTGKYAKWFDECSRSQADSATGSDPQVTATSAWTTDFTSLAAVTDRLWYGTFDPESSVYCWSFLPWVAAPTAVNEQTGLVEENPEYIWYQMMYKKVFDYFHAFGKHKKTIGTHTFAF